MNISPEDESIINEIDLLTIDELAIFSKVYIVKDLKHYMSLQIKWMEDERYFVGIKVCHNPSDEEVIKDWINHHNSERFRAFYILRYPANVEKID